MNQLNRNSIRAIFCTIGVGTLAAATPVTAKNWDEWGAPANLNSLSSPDINTASVDGCASHSPDGLTIIFNSNRTGNQDLYMASRESKSWPTARRLKV